MSPTKAVIHVCRLILKYEKQLVNEARASGIKCIRPTVILASLAGLMYWGNPYDLIPEALISGWLGKFEDILIVTLVLTYIVLEVVNRSGVRPPLDDVDFEAEALKHQQVLAQRQAEENLRREQQKQQEQEAARGAVDADGVSYGTSSAGNMQTGDDDIFE